MRCLALLFACLLARGCSMMPAFAAAPESAVLAHIQPLAVVR
jgi:hypothetical protein